MRFTEAASVFSDPPARIFPDGAHSENEAREIIIERSSAKLLLLVYFADPMMDQLRIISARRATKAEQRDYEEHLAG